MLHNKFFVKFLFYITHEFTICSRTCVVWWIVDRLLQSSQFHSPFHIKLALIVLIISFIIIYTMLSHIPISHYVNFNFFLQNSCTIYYFSSVVFTRHENFCYFSREIRGDSVINKKRQEKQWWVMRNINNEF
jgi:hypothetical protein